jgi:TonB family protein
MIAALLLMASICFLGNSISFAVGFPQAGQQSTDPNSALPPKETSPARVFVSREVLAKMIISKKAAEYTPEAAAKKWEGPVVVSIVIDQDGAVSSAKQRGGDHLMEPTAVAAVKQWKFHPAVYKGKRVEVAAEAVVDVEAPPRPEDSGRLVVDMDTAATHLLSSPKPDYPNDVAITRIQGDIIFRCYVGTDGRVQKVVLLSGHPLLIKLAEKAARQAVYMPFTKDGVPTEAVVYAVEEVKPPLK